MKDSKVLTYFFHYFNFIFADSVAAVIVEVLSSLEVLTLDTRPASRVL